MSAAISRVYVSDIGRVWPVNGRYSAQQRELLQFVLEPAAAGHPSSRCGGSDYRLRVAALRAGFAFRFGFGFARFAADFATSTSDNS